MWTDSPSDVDISPPQALFRNYTTSIVKWNIICFGLQCFSRWEMSSLDIGAWPKKIMPQNLGIICDNVAHKTLIASEVEITIQVCEIS